MKWRSRRESRERTRRCTLAANKVKRRKEVIGSSATGWVTFNVTGKAEQKKVSDGKRSCGAADAQRAAMHKCSFESELRTLRN